MDFLNKALAQISDLFRSMTPAAHITAGLLLLVIVISVAYLFNHQLSATDSYLFSEPVSGDQLPPMLAAFGKKGLTDYELQGNQIKVPRGKQAIYMAALADDAVLPRTFLDPIKKAIQSGGPFANKKRTEEALKVAYQEQLAEVVNNMTGVEHATVMYNVENQGGFSPKKSITASVTVKPVGSQPLSDDLVQKIRLAVGPAIGAAPESVSVVDSGPNGRSYPGALPGSVGDISQNPYLNTQRTYEQNLTDKIFQSLSFIKGAVVTVNVELNTELEQTQTATKIDPKTVPVAIKEKGKTLNQNTTLPTGRPGLANQGGINTPAAVGSGANGSRTEEETTDRQEQSVASSETRQTKFAGLTPKRVTASIGVPSSYYEEIWRQKNPKTNGEPPKAPDAAALTQIETEEKAKIQGYVLHVLPAPLEPGKDPTELVTVRTFQHIPAPEISKPSTVDHALVWFSSHSSAIGMGLLVIVSLLMVRSIVRSVPAPVTAGAPEPQIGLAATEEDVEEETPRSESAPRLRRRRSKSGPSLRDELVEIVRDDPDAAANILRSWIGTAN